MTEYIGYIRRYVGHEPVLIAACSCIVFMDGKILLQRRRDDRLWSYHGGCIDLGERAEDAAKRELFEESGLIAERLNLLGVFSGEETWHTYPNGDRVFAVDIVYICDSFSGELQNETDEVIEHKWFTPENLPSELADNAYLPIQALLQKIRAYTNFV